MDVEDIPRDKLSLAQMAAAHFYLGSIQRYSYVDFPNSSTCFRLIELLPPEEPFRFFVRFTLKTYKVAEAPTYHALSYTWRDDQAPKSLVSCDGAVLEVGQNLHDALLQLRRSGTLRLWADAICINQSNTAERNTQVTIMKRIYEKASLVRVWLGPENETTASAFRLAKRFASRRPFEAYTGSRSETDPEIKEGVSAIVQLLEMPWFSRVWVIQEMAAAEGSCVQIVCGTQTLRFPDLVTARDQVFCYYMSRPYLAAPSYHASSMLETYQSVRRGHAVDLLSLLLRHRRFYATDPRDKIYSLLGLASDAGRDHLHIIPDYNMSLLEVYKDVTMRVLEHSKSLDILGTPHVVDVAEHPDWPSWIPHWEEQTIDLPLTRRGLMGQYVYEFNASTITTPVLILPKDDKNLRLYGVSVDKILHVGAVMGPSTRTALSGSSVLKNLLNMFSDIRTYSEWEDIAQARSGKRYHTGEDMLTVYRRTLVLAHYLPHYNQEADFLEWDQHMTCVRLLNFFYLYRVRFISYLVISLYVFVVPNILGFIVLFITWFWGRYFWVNIITNFLVLPYIGNSRNPTTPGELRYRHAMSLAITGRRMIRTQRGYIGLAPRIAARGDHIAVMHGGRVPLLVRRYGTSWKLIGDGYIHGIMNGEAFLEHHEDRTAGFQEFDIC